MKRLIIYCEGPTEESFVKTVLNPYFLSMDVSITPIGAGGVSKYSKIKKELTRLCKGDSTATVSTMLDYYGLPHDVPGVSSTSGTLYDKARNIETAIESDLGGLGNLIVNLSLHEYEGLLFSNISAFANTGIANESQLSELKKIKEEFETPEHINNSFETAPSKRIEKIIPGYLKITDGTKVAEAIGVDGISKKCRHFEKWIAKLANWAKEGIR